MSRHRRLVPHLLLFAVLALAMGCATLTTSALPLPRAGHDFNALGFTVRHAWVRFALIVTEPFREDLSAAERDAHVSRFFELSGLIREQERIAGDLASSQDAVEDAQMMSSRYRAERESIENVVESIIADRLTTVAREAGLTRHMGIDVVWPPASIEFEDPPSVLLTSPRTEIRVEDRTLLEGDLSLAEREGLEARAEADGDVAALVVQIGGIALYPAIVPAWDDYRAVMRNVAHEWIHHYLYFAPLGRSYDKSGELRTLNETVANLAGDELGDMLVERYPLVSAPFVRSAPVSAGEAQEPPAAVDFGGEMQQLRLEVEALLANGQAEQAERLMDDRRAYLAQNGHYVRKINQAYFAFHGAYADGPASIDPIGPKLRELRARSPSIDSFISKAREITSERDLDALLGKSE